MQAPATTWCEKGALCRLQSIPLTRLTLFRGQRDPRLTRHLQVPLTEFALLVYLL